MSRVFSVKYKAIPAVFAGLGGSLWLLSHLYSQDAGGSGASHPMKSRADNLAHLRSFKASNPVDVLIIGGDQLGVECGLSCMNSGLTAAVVEKNDFGMSSSPFSRPMLEQLFPLESLSFSNLYHIRCMVSDRTRLVQRATYLFQPIKMVIPCYDVYQLSKIYLMCKLMDAASFWRYSTSEFLKPYEVLRNQPYLRMTSPTNSALLGAVLYPDFLLNEARFCFTSALAVSSLGAPIANYTEAKKVEILLNEKADGTFQKVYKTVVFDHVAMQHFTVYSKAIINTSKVSFVDTRVGGSQNISWETQVNEYALLDTQYCPQGQYGVAILSNDGAIFQTPSSGTCILSSSATLTHEDFDKAKELPVGQRAKPYLGIPKHAVTAADNRTTVFQTSSYLTVEKDGSYISCADSRREWTSCSQIASAAVKAASKVLFHSASVKAHSPAAFRFSSFFLCSPDVPHDIDAHWRSAYGNCYNSLYQLSTKEGKLFHRIIDGSPATEAEVLWCCRYEHCEHVDDFILRRSSLVLSDACLQGNFIKNVARLMAVENRWSSSREQQEIARASALCSLLPTL